MLENVTHIHVYICIYVCVRVCVALCGQTATRLPASVFRSWVVRCNPSRSLKTDNNVLCCENGRRPTWLTITNPKYRPYEVLALCRH